MEINRIPATERLLLKLPARRQGLTPRFTLEQEYTDNLFFTSADRSDDFLTKIVPGFHYTHTARQWEIDVDYETEARLYVNNSEQNRVISAQTGEVFGYLSATQQMRFFVFDRFESFQDPTQQLALAPLAVFSRTWVNIFDFSGERALSPTDTIFARYGNTFWSVDSPGFISSLMHDVEFGAKYRLTRRDRLTPAYRFRFFDFETGTDFHLQAFFLQEEHEFSETLVLTGSLGLAGVWPDRGQRNPEILVQVSARKSFELAILTISYARDITTSGALGFPLLTQIIGASAKMKVTDALLNHSEIQFLLSDALPRAIDFTTIDAKFGFSYAFSSWLLGRLEYNFVAQNSDFSGVSSDQTANKVSLALTAIF